MTMACTVTVIDGTLPQAEIDTYVQRAAQKFGMEGQYHFKKGDYYYIVYSPHSCCGPQSDYDVYADIPLNC